jgi:hypothetical protein
MRHQRLTLIRNVVFAFAASLPINTPRVWEHLLVWCESIIVGLFLFHEVTQKAGTVDDDHIFKNLL